MQGVAGSLITNIYPRKFVFEQNLANPQNIYPLKILGYTVVATNTPGHSHVITETVLVTANHPIQHELKVC